MIIHLTNQELNSLREEAKKGYPIEACAMLFGKTTKGEAFVRRIEVAPNILRSTVRFEIEPQKVLQSFREAEESGLEFIGIFHSHPAPATPSALDLRYMRLWGNAVWLILSSTEGNFAAFQMTNGQVHEVKLEVK